MKKRKVKRAAKRAAKPSSFRGLVREMKQRNKPKRRKKEMAERDDEDTKKKPAPAKPKPKQGGAPDDPALDVDLTQPPESPVRNPESAPGGDVVGTPEDGEKTKRG